MKKEKTLAEKILEAEKEYQRDGIAVIPGVFKQREIDLLRGAALMALTQRNPEYHRGPYLETKWDGKFPALIFFPALVSPYLDSIRRDSRMVEIVRHFLGDDVKQLNNQVYFRLPGDGDEFAWHQDITFRKPRDQYPRIESSYLQTIIAVDEITMDNAPIEFIRGSQVMGEHELETKAGVNEMLRKFERHGLKGEKVLAKPGDVMIWTVMTVHGSESNRSKSMRMTYMNGFAKADSAPDFPMYLINGNVQDLDKSKL